MQACPWDSFFPSARRIAVDTLPTSERVLTEACESGFLIEGHHTVRFLLARSGPHLVKRIAKRSISSLRQVPPEEFEAGLVELDAHFGKRAMEPIFEEMETFVLRPS